MDKTSNFEQHEGVYHYEDKRGVLDRITGALLNWYFRRVKVYTGVLKDRSPVFVLELSEWNGKGTFVFPADSVIDIAKWAMSVKKGHLFNEDGSVTIITPEWSLNIPERWAKATLLALRSAAQYYVEALLKSAGELYLKNNMNTPEGANSADENRPTLH